MTTKGREIGAFAIWLPAAIAFAAGYLVFLTKIVGVRLGMEGGAYVVVLPMALLAFAALIWLPFFIWRRRATSKRLGITGAVAAALLIAVALVLLCGFRCFGFEGSTRFLGEAAMIFAGSAAYLHDKISRAFLGGEEQ